jgi:hypothetical protein
MSFYFEVEESSMGTYGQARKHAAVVDKFTGVAKLVGFSKMGNKFSKLKVYTNPLQPSRKG